MASYGLNFVDRSFILLASILLSFSQLRLRFDRLV